MASTLPTDAVAEGASFSWQGQRALCTSLPLFLGIDPGQSGGLATIGGGLCMASKMPATERDVWAFFDALTNGRTTSHDIFAVIEHVHSMPKQGVASSFKFGTGYGGLRMALIAAEIPFEFVTPHVWQKAMGCLSRGDKNVTKAKAQQLFPTLKITHATADALLIAEYARRLWHVRNGKGKDAG